MPDVFIIASSKDRIEAEKVKNALNAAGVDARYTPDDIPSGEDFTFSVVPRLDGARAVVLILSGNAMRSQLVCNQIAVAVQKELFILPVRVDRESLTPVFELLLQTYRIVDGYGRDPNALQRIVAAVRERLARDDEQCVKGGLPDRAGDEIGVKLIAEGGPDFEEGRTLFAKISEDAFFLAPPAGLGPECLEWARERNFSPRDRVFGGSLSEYTEKLPIKDLYERIEQSRVRIFEDFRNEKNGCYFNSPKYGVEQVTPFARTADEAERPKMTVTLYSTDYFTHRVVKDVCKQLIREKNEYLSEGIDYAHIGANRLFFTSLGVNLLLAESSPEPGAGILVSSRSVNASETYGRTQFSLSVIEGVSVSDCDAARGEVSLKAAAERGLLEELGVGPEMLEAEPLRFRQLFVNKANLELGFWGIVRLNRGLTIEDDVIPLHGKDEELEVADCRRIAAEDLEDFIRANRENILPQAMYVLRAYLESEGRLIAGRRGQAYCR